MKKLLGLFLFSVLGVLPFTVMADARINPTCEAEDANGVVKCTVGYIIDSATPQNTVTVKLTEVGGAQVIEQDIKSIRNESFGIEGVPTENNGVWTINLASIEPVSGEHGLFEFSYRKSGEEGCEIKISIGNVSAGTEKPENPQTGEILPYLSIGAILLIAGATYIITKNKTKMFNI